MKKTGYFNIGDVVKSFGTKQRFDSGTITKAEIVTGKTTPGGLQLWRYWIEPTDGTPGFWRNMNGLGLVKEGIHA